MSRPTEIKRLPQLQSQPTMARARRYLAIGHVARDVVPNGYQPGGTATFAARLAQVQGLTTAVVTSTHPSYDLRAILPHTLLHNVPAPADTIFDNSYDGDQRTQIVRSVAQTIRPADIPAEWHTAEIVHLGPIANEIEPAVIELFDRDRQLVGLTPQGWMRRWDDHGRVYAQPFPAAEYLLRRATLVVISEEDLLNEEMLTHYRAWADILVMTQSAAGCRVFRRDDENQPDGVHITAVRHPPIDPTGAGDIFATALFIRYAQNGGNILDAADYANQIAAHSVTQTSLEAKVGGK